MKRKIKKLNLGKSTISNLTAAEMNRQVGAGPTNGNCAPSKGKTCHGTCLTCGPTRCDY